MPKPTIRPMAVRPADEVARTLGAYDDNHTDPGEPRPPGAEAAPPPPPAAQWRVAVCLVRLREQINAKFPDRNKESDGTIGDMAHCPGTSDHCPNIVDQGVGVVTAMDITHDPDHGLNAGDVAEFLRQKQDPRIKYIISNGRIANFKALDGQLPFAWRPYTGANPHDHHFHLSVKPEKNGPGGYDNGDDWVL